MKRKIAAVLMLSVLIVVVLAAAYKDEEDDDGTILRFSTMAGVTGPYVGATSPVRSLPGEEVPWIISEACGFLRRNGDLRLRVRGLIIPGSPFNSSNPFPSFRAVVSCQSIDANNNPKTVNVITAPFPADSAGNALINISLSLPKPCIAPTVFVTQPTSDPPAWLAATGL